MTISVSVILAFALALFVTLVLPGMLLLFLGVTKRVSLRPLGYGFLAFFLSQIVLRLPLLNLLGAQSWFQEFASATPLLYGILLALTAGLFEESARLGGARLLKGQRTYRDMLSFGLGHGLCEVILLAGLTHLNNLIYCFLLSSGLAWELSQMLPPGQMDFLAAQFSAVTAPQILAGILERFSALLFHLFATCLIFLAVERKKWILFPAAILAHTLFNCVALLPLGLWAIEAILLALGLLCGALVLKSRRFFPEARPEIPLTPGFPGAPASSANLQDRKDR